ncbi:S24 family peptidase [Pacificibacter sp. AS14]|uniref:S24 family peptidase n=1 Tax=Pacificibacter sp. AS14 TaxID=3135785 RepID=UPI00316C1227
MKTHLGRSGRHIDRALVLCGYEDDPRSNVITGLSMVIRASISGAAASYDLVDVPLHEASLAAGAGAANGAEPIVDYLSFRRDWLRRIGTAPANAVLARVTGDSMEPTIWAGDMVLVDRSKTVVPVRTSSSKKGRSAIYAVLDDGHARVKRIERPSEDQILLLSDNPDYPPRIRPPKNALHHR